MGIRQRVSELFTGGRERVSEIIGRVSYTATAIRSRWLRADDRTQADYEWFDNLRRGKLATYKLGALFAKPMIEHIVSWSLGGGFKVSTGDDITDAALAEFVKLRLPDIITFKHEAMGLGDAYLICNADGTLSAVPANQVHKETDPLDYRRVIWYEITTTLETATVTDRYALDGRTVTIKRVNLQPEVLTYPLVQPGRLPVVHYPYGASTNEVFGHPFYESLVPLFAEYDDVLTNSLEGVKTMSNPKPVLENVDNPQTELEALATRNETYEDLSGNTRSESVIDMDAHQIIATTGQFNMKGPSSFTGDSWQMLKVLFYLMLQHANVPEWVWGGAIASSKASVDAQMPAWSKFIQGQQMMIEGFIRELLEIYLGTISLYTPGIKTGLKIEIEWPEVAPEDAELHLKYVQWAGSRNLVTGERELDLLNLVKDASAEYAAAVMEAKARQAEQDKIGDAWEMALDEARRNVDNKQEEDQAA